MTAKTIAILIATSHPVTKRAYPDDPGNTYSVPDENITYSWIIDLKNKALFGPMQSQQEFDAKRKQLHVGEIELWSVDEARSKGAQVY